MTQLKVITPIRGRAANQEYSCFIFKCPYHAKVIKTFDTIYVYQTVKQPLRYFCKTLVKQMQ